MILHIHSYSGWTLCLIILLKLLRMISSCTGLAWAPSFSVSVLRLLILLLSSLETQHRSNPSNILKVTFQTLFTTEDNVCFWGVYKWKLWENSCQCKINHNICNINTLAFRKDNYSLENHSGLFLLFLTCLSSQLFGKPELDASCKTLTWQSFAFGWDCRQLRERNKDITAVARREWRRNVACVCVSRTWGHIIDCRAPRTHKGGRSLAETSQTITCLDFIKTRTQIEPPAGLRRKDWQLILLANGETSTKEPVGGSQGSSPAEALIGLQAATWHSENTGDVLGILKRWRKKEQSSNDDRGTRPKAQGLLYKCDTPVSQTVPVCIAAFKKW